MRRIFWVCALMIVSGCVTSQFGSIPVPQLTDDQLIADLYSVYSKLGIVQERISFLAAIRPQPSYVLRGSTISTASGSAYVSGNNIYGTAMGSSQSTYWLEDRAALGRAVNTAVTITQLLNHEMLENRRVALETEAFRRMHDQEYTNNRMVANFWAQNPDLQNEKLLVGCVAPWVQILHPNANLEQLLPFVASGTREIVGNRKSVSNTILWFGVFSERITLSDGHKVDYADYVRAKMTEQDGKVTGEGVLYTGQRFTLDGILKDGKLVGKVVNTTPGHEWDADFSLDTTPMKFAGTYYGKAPNGTYEGSVTLVR